MPMSQPNFVYLVGGEAEWRALLTAALEARSRWQVRFYADGATWLQAAAHVEPGCVVMDLDEPGVGGLDVLNGMNASGAAHAAVMLSGTATIAVIVEAMRAGAIDVVQRPATWDALQSALIAAYQHLRRKTERDRCRRRALDRIDRLSPRERDVMTGMLEGLPNKLIAHRLGLSPRTVEVHRASLMAKMESGSLVDVMRCAVSADLFQLDLT